MIQQKPPMPDPRQISQTFWPVFVPAFIIALAILATQLIKILALNQGHMVYTLDDPYIHLALAERLAQGHYGLNEGEFTAPSSSILWPFLLIPFAHTALHEWMPFFINILCTILILGISTVIINQLIKTPENVLGLVLKVTLVLLISVVVQTYSLFWNGLEHLLQIFITLLAAYGLVRFIQTDNIPWYLILAIVIGPLVRYEMVLISFASLGVLFLNRKKITAILIGFLSLLPLSLFSLFLYFNDHSLLPNSVLVKTPFIFNDAKLLRHASNFFSKNVIYMKTIFVSTLPTLITFALLVMALYMKRKVKKELLLVLAGLLVLTTRIMVTGLETGLSGSARYIVYSISFCIPLLLFVYSETISQWLKNKVYTKLAGIIVLSPIVFSSSFYLLVMTPAFSNNIYLQQYQLQRFLEHYSKPIAISDLGLTSYKNPNKVIDLIGLGHKEAYDLRIARAPDWVNVVLEKNNVELIIVHDNILNPPHIPNGTVSEWKKIGDLKLLVHNYTLGGNAVSFYVTTPEAENEVLPILEWLKSNVPSGASVEIY